MLKFISLVLMLCSRMAMSETFLIRAGHILNVEDGVWRKDQIVLIHNGRIKTIGLNKIPTKLPVIDFSKNYIIPGLIDSHTHLFLDDPSYGKNYASGMQEFYKKNNLASRHLLATKRAQSLVSNGITTVRDLGQSGSKLIKKIRKSNLRFYSSGPGHTPQDGQLPKGTSNDIIFSEYARFDDKTFLNLRSNDRKTLKLYADEDPNPSLTNPDLLKKWANKGRELGLKIAIHAIFNSSIQSSIEAGASSIEHGTHVSQDQLNEMAKRHIYWVPSTGSAIFLNEKLKSVRSDHISNELKIICQKIPLANKSGVKIVFGSDFYYSTDAFGVSFGEAAIEALLYLNQCGLPAIEAIRSATLHSSHLLGISDVGRLEEGAWADFVVLKADPLTDMNNIKRPIGVYIGGKKAY